MLVARRSADSNFLRLSAQKFWEREVLKRDILLANLDGGPAPKREYYIKSLNNQPGVRLVPNSNSWWILISIRSCKRNVSRVCPSSLKKTFETPHLIVMFQAIGLMPSKSKINHQPARAFNKPLAEAEPTLIGARTRAICGIESTRPPNTVASALFALFALRTLACYSKTLTVDTSIFKLVLFAATLAKYISFGCPTCFSGWCYLQRGSRYSWVCHQTLDSNALCFGASLELRSEHRRCQFSLLVSRPGRADHCPDLRAHTYTCMGVHVLVQLYSIRGSTLCSVSIHHLVQLTRT